MSTELIAIKQAELDELNVKKTLVAKENATRLLRADKSISDKQAEIDSLTAQLLAPQP